MGEIWSKKCEGVGTTWSVPAPAAVTRAAILVSGSAARGTRASGSGAAVCPENE